MQNAKNVVTMRLTLFVGRLGLYLDVLGRRMPDPTGVVTQNLVPGAFPDPGQELGQ